MIASWKKDVKRSSGSHASNYDTFPSFHSVNVQEDTTVDKGADINSFSTQKLQPQEFQRFTKQTIKGTDAFYRSSVSWTSAYRNRQIQCAVEKGIVCHLSLPMLK